MMLSWKPEHRRALWLAVAVGALIGFIHGIYVSPPIFGFNRCDTLVYWLSPNACGDQDWWPILGWPLAYGGLGAVFTYNWQLMRS